MNNDNAKAARAARKQALIVECASQRRQIDAEISLIRAPSMLSGGGILQTLGNGNLKGPLALAGMVIGLIATRPGRFMPLIATAMSVFKLAQSGLAMLRQRST